MSITCCSLSWDQAQQAHLHLFQVSLAVRLQQSVKLLGQLSVFMALYGGVTDSGISQASQRQLSCLFRLKFLRAHGQR